MRPPMNVAFVGTGFVSDMYAKTILRRPEIRLIGAYDRNPENLSAFAEHWKTRTYDGLQGLLEDQSVDVVVNLTNPGSHFEVTAKCLEARKHVYTEKPMAMTLDQSSQLVRLAEQHSVYLAVAPCTILSSTAQTIWRAITQKVVGQTRLVYINFDDGMIAPNQSPWNWTNGFGVRWPARDEFEVGSTLMHASYMLSWLAAFFGPARTVTSFSSCLIPDKGIPVGAIASDFSVACVEYDNRIVARLTCGTVAPRDKSFTLIGDNGIIYTHSIRDDEASVYVQYIPTRGVVHGFERRLNAGRRYWQKYLPFIVGDGDEWHLKRRLPVAREAKQFGDGRDFSLGLIELSEAIRQRRPCRLSGQLGRHIVEVSKALEEGSGRRQIHTTFDPIEPLEWTQ